METNAKAVIVEILSVRLLALDAASTDHGIANETAMIWATAINSSVRGSLSLIRSLTGGWPEELNWTPKSPLTKSQAQRAHRSGSDLSKWY